MGKGCCENEEVIEETDFQTTTKTRSNEIDSETKETSFKSKTGTKSKTSITNKESKETLNSTHSGYTSAISVEKMDHGEHLNEYAHFLLSDPMNISLTKLFLNEELLENEQYIRTTDNVGLGNCIYVNVNNYLAKFPYAVTADCYCIFCDFFGPLIEYYHGPPQSEATLEAMFGDVDKYSEINLNSSNRNRVLYTDITIRRNIEGFKFTPKMTSSDRLTLIKNIEPIFRKIFQDEEEVARIPIEWYNKFDAIKNELDDIGAMHGYPKNRLHLVYDTAGDSYLGIIFNFDDHLQIIASTNDGNIGHIYQKIFEVYTHPELDVVDFIAHPYLGFLTLSPAYVGIGMTIRIIAKFPFLSRFVDIDKTLLKTFNVIVEPENPNCPTNGLLCISNKITLNKTEEETLLDMVDVFNILYEFEEEIEHNTPMAIQNDTMPIETCQRLYDLVLRSESKSYTKKYLTMSLFQQFINKKTRFNNMLGHCIRGNAYYPGSLFPRAADSDCYIKYRQFFIPILYETNRTKSLGHPIRPKYGLASDSVQFMLNHPDIRSYRVRFSRNLENFPFPMTMSDKDREEVERIMLHIFDEIPVELEGEYHPLVTIRKSLDFEEMIQYKMLPVLNDVDKCTGCGRDWPSKRGIYLCKKDIMNPDLVLFVLLNIHDHIKVVCLDPTGNNLSGCYDRAVKMMHFLDLRFDKRFARKPGYGFLTTLPQNVGCGMRISAKIYLKNLGNNREIFENKCRSLNFAYRGSNGAGSPADNNEFDVSYKINMNVSEDFILLTFCQRLKELILLERKFDPRILMPDNAVFLPENSSLFVTELIGTQTKNDQIESCKMQKKSRGTEELVNEVEMKNPPEVEYVDTISNSEMETHDEPKVQTSSKNENSKKDINEGLPPIEETETIPVTSDLNKSTEIYKEVSKSSTCCKKSKHSGVVNK